LITSSAVESSVGGWLGPFGSLEIDQEPVGRGMLKWQIARFLAAQNAAA